MSPGPSSQRATLGVICAGFGLIHLLPVIFVLLSSGGPAPVLVSASVWSQFFFGHFVGLVLGGLGYLLFDSAHKQIFHGGPVIDFLLLLTGFILVSSVGGVLLSKGEGPSWPALAPGVYLAAMGLRLRSGRAFIGV